MRRGGNGIFPTLSLHDKGVAIRCLYAYCLLTRRRHGNF